jgi:hypothetical protein
MYRTTINLNNSPKYVKALFVVAIVGFFILVNHLMKNKAYDLSLMKASNHYEVVEYLGEPIQAGFFVTGEASNNETEISYSISGPLNSADVYTYAEFSNGRWEFHDLVVTVDGINKSIDVLATQ